MKIFCIAALLSVAAVQPGLAGAFTPKTYIKAVLDASLEMRREEQLLEQAKNNYLSAVLDAALPSITAGMSTTLYDNSGSWRLRNGEVNTTLNASLNLYDSASSPVKKMKRAKLSYESSELSFLIAKQGEAVKALNRFYELYASQKRVGTAKVNLASREQQYTDTNEQYQSGTRSKIEVTQSEGDKLQSELALAQAEFAAQKALMAFNELINVEPEVQQEVDLGSQTVNVPLPFPKEDLARALQNNFSLRQQRTALEKTRLDTRSETLANLPELSVDAFWQRSKLGLPGAFGGAGASPRYGMTASLNFPFGFFGVQNYLGVKTQATVRTAAELQLQNSIRALKTSVLSAQKDIELQVKSQKLLEFQVKAQKDAMENLQSEYAQGGAEFLQLDSAQTKLLDSSNNQINAVNDLDIALANYMTLLGEKIWE
ncbi:MAG: TolC family protein [Elusimicrobia bacterium]|nr:TolC family protein [Elusimicrobiota bacterium]